MPFDALPVGDRVVPVEEDPVLRLLEAGLGRIAHPSRWCRGYIVRSFLGWKMYCAYGAITQRTVFRETDLISTELAALNCLDQAAKARGFWNVQCFNDHSATTHEMVVEVFREAIALRRKELGNAV